MNYNQIMEEVSTLLDNCDYYEKMSKAVNPYGDGCACGRISDFLQSDTLNNIHP